MGDMLRDEILEQGRHGTCGTGGAVQRDWWRSYVGLVAQSVITATDMLGHWDVGGLSAIDPCPRHWISVCTKPKDVGMPL